MILDEIKGKLNKWKRSSCYLLRRIEIWFTNQEIFLQKLSFFTEDWN